MPSYIPKVVLANKKSNKRKTRETQETTLTLHRARKQRVLELHVSCSSMTLSP